MLVLPLFACQAFPSSRIVVKRSSIVQRQPSRVGYIGDAELWKRTHRVAQRRCPRILLPNTLEPARCQLPLLGQNLCTLGSSSISVPLGDFGPKPVGCIYSLHPGCHTFGNTRLRLPSIGFTITETRLQESPPSRRGPGCPEGRPVPPSVAAPVIGSRYLLPHRRCGENHLITDCTKTSHE